MFGRELLVARFQCKALGSLDNGPRTVRVFLKIHVDLPDQAR